MKKTIDHIRTELAKLEAFAARYDTDRFPPGTCGCTLDHRGGIVTIYAGEFFTKTAMGRASLLALVAEIFGADGWTRKIGYSKSCWNWYKEIHGMPVVIDDAEPADSPREGSAVAGESFPAPIKRSTTPEAMSADHDEHRAFLEHMPEEGEECSTTPGESL